MVTCCEAAFFELAGKAGQVIVIMLSLEGERLLFGKSMLLRYDGFFDAAEGIYNPP